MPVGEGLGAEDGGAPEPLLPAAPPPPDPLSPPPEPLVDHPPPVAPPADGESPEQSCPLGGT